MSSRIWRYMDMTKFISLLVNEAIYFACPNEFQDPYEGYYPKSHIEAWEKVTMPIIDDVIKNNPHQNMDTETAIASLHKKLKTLYKSSSLKFGISCWHRSEYESAAMWKLYAASEQCLAIESTVEQLQASIAEKIIVENVRYLDFENDPIEKGCKHYGLFLKRKSFEHEKELRTTILLPEGKEGKGTLVKCCLDTLISSIHISPLSADFIRNDVECLLQKLRLNKGVKRSNLLDKPSY